MLAPQGGFLSLVRAQIFPKAGIGVALQKLAFDLITESEALERERAVFSRSK